MNKDWESLFCEESEKQGWEGSSENRNIFSKKFS